MKISIVLIIVFILIPFSLYSLNCVYDISHCFPFTLNDFKSAVIDARALGMGGTSILSSKGADFVFNNPSLLGILSQKSFRISCNAKTGKTYYVFVTDQSELNYDVNFPLYIKANGVAFSLPFKPARYKDLRFGMGLGYRNYFDLSCKSKRSSFDEDYFYNATEKVSGGYNNLVFAGSFCWCDKLMGGLSVSIPFMSTVKADGESKLIHQTDIDVIEWVDKATIDGVFYTFSGSYCIDDKTMLGFRMRTGFTQKVEYDYDNLRYNDRDPFFYEKLEYIIPPEYGISASCKIYENTIICMEYLYNDFGKYKYDNYYHKGYLFDDSNPGHVIRLGLETGRKTKYRTGFFIQSVPVYEHQNSGEINPEPYKEIGFTSGVGINIWKNTSLDTYISYSFLNYNDSYYVYHQHYSLDESNKRLILGITIGCEF